MSYGAPYSSTGLGPGPGLSLFQTPVLPTPNNFAVQRQPINLSPGMSPNLHGLVAQPSVPHHPSPVPGPIAGPHNVRAYSHGAGTTWFTAQHPPLGMSPNFNGRNLVAQPSVPYHAYSPVPVPIAGPSVMPRAPSMQQHWPAVHNANDQVAQARRFHDQIGSDFFFNGEPAGRNGTLPQSGPGAGHPCPWTLDNYY